MGALLAKALAIAVVIHAPCPTNWPGLPGQAPGCFQPPSTVYVSPTARPGLLNHELGHLIDHAFLTNADRGRFRVYAAVPGTGPADVPFGSGWTDSPNPLNERFAEAVRLCAHSQKWPALVTDYGYAPTTRTHRRVCRWLNLLAKRVTSPERCGSAGCEPAGAASSRATGPSRS